MPFCDRREPWRAAAEWRYARSVVVQWLAIDLLADAKFLNDGFVAFGIRLSEVIEQASTLAHHRRPAQGGMVLTMRLEMLVNSPIRVLRIAIWTSGEPVSVA